jgi:tetratricopeptide (TPR) repeat protein
MKIISRFIIFVLLLGNLPANKAEAQTGGTGTQSSAAMQNYRRGRDLEAMNRTNEAGTYYNEAVRICLDEVSRNTATRDTYTVITWTLQRQRKYTDVITWGERGLRAYPDEFPIVEIMGEAFFYLDNYDRSLAYMQRYVNALPEGERVSVAYFFTGEIYRLTQKYHYADIAYTTAVRFEPNIALWWYRLASVREETGDSRPAIEAYQQALRLNPNYREARNGLARLQSN